MRELLHEFSSVLEDAVGLEEAEGFISLVGGRMGTLINADYLAAAGQETLSLEQVAAVLVDLKTRIKSGFTIEELDGDRIILANTACPFGEYVKDRPSLCMITSTVFGRITADNLGYARIEIERAIARRDSRCRVVIHLSEGKGGREYFG